MRLCQKYDILITDFERANPKLLHAKTGAAVARHIFGENDALSLIHIYRNVERFANYLRTFCNKTQFIVVTHRRGTMEAADVLYGVTMQEQGVSKILHLDLNQMEQILKLEKK